MENTQDNFNEETFLPGIDRKKSFLLPQGYFESLTARILNRIEAEQELQEYSNLRENKKNSLSVPDGYFSSLADRIEHKYEHLEFPGLSGIKKPVLKTLPADYFERTEKRLTEKLELEAELSEFPSLSSIPKKNSFKVRPGYFENSNESMQDTKSQPRISSFRQITAIFFRPQMAVAASLILIVGLSAIWFFTREDARKLDGDCLTLACLEKNEILNEKNIQHLDEESLYEMVDEAMLDEHLSGETTSYDSVNTEKN